LCGRMGQGGGEEEEQSEEGRTRQHEAIVASGCVWIVSRGNAKIAETIRSVWAWPAVKIEEWLLLFQ
jgi:hypothetical protein